MNQFAVELAFLEFSAFQRKVKPFVIFAGHDSAITVTIATYSHG